MTISETTEMKRMKNSKQATSGKRKSRERKGAGGFKKKAIVKSHQDGRNWEKLSEKPQCACPEEV